MYEIFLTDCEGKLTVLKEPQDGCWINMLDPTTEEIDHISGLVHAERDFITAALDEEERRGSNRKTIAHWCLPISPW